MPQSTAIEVVTILEAVGRHGYSKFAKRIKVLGEGKALIRLKTNGESRLGAGPHGDFACETRDRLRNKETRRCKMPLR
jgi:hypothetical protein